MSNIPISVAKSNSNRPNSQIMFRELDVWSLDSLAAMTTKHVWSPILWAKGVRKSDNYKFCQIVALDFDTGTPTWEDAHHACRYCHIITSTKSHRVEKRSGKKVSPAVDRFRLILPLVIPMAPSKMQYKRQMKELMLRFPGCDSSCCDAGRFFWPGKEVLAVRSAAAIPVPEVAALSRVEGDFTKMIERQRCGGVPRYVEDFLNSGAPAGGRRPALFKVAAALARAGKNLGEVKSLLIAAPWERDDIPMDEAMRHIERGFRAARIESEAFYSRRGHG